MHNFAVTISSSRFSLFSCYTCRENLYEFGRYVRESGLEPYYTIPRLKKILKQVIRAHFLSLILACHENLVRRIIFYNLILGFGSTEIHSFTEAYSL